MDNTRRTLLGLIFSGLIAILVGVILQLVWNTERLSEDSAAATRTVLDQTVVAITATAEIIPTPTRFVARPTTDATTSNYDSVLKLANEWPLVVYEPFDENLRGWSTGGNGTYSWGERRIVDGRYRWDLTAVESFIWYTAPISVPFDDFFASVTVDKVDRIAGDTSIVFRYVDGDNYYEFGLCDDVTQFRVYIENAGSRSSLVDCTPHRAINSAESNRIAVLAQSDRYLLFINDHYVTTLNDETHSRGSVGVGLDMDEGQANVFEFDDMVVRSADIEK